MGGGNQDRRHLCGYFICVFYQCELNGNAVNYKWFSRIRFYILVLP